MKNPQIKKALFGLLTSAAMTNAFADVDNGSRQYDNFKDNNIDPFEVCTTKAPHTLDVFSKRVRTQWHRDGYDTGRKSKGVEACAEMPITGKGTFAFTFNLPSSGSGAYGKSRYPADNEGGIAQIFQNGDVCTGTWAVIVIVRQNQLVINYRSRCGTPSEVVLDTSIKRNTDHYLVIKFDPSRNNSGFMKVTYNGEVKVNDTGINFAFAEDGQWTENTDSLTNGAYLTAKIGQYNYSDGQYEEEGKGAIRTVYYDNVNWKKN